MPGRAAVVDASALAAVLFREPGRGAALARLAGRRLYAPDLLRYEVAQVAWKKVRREPGLRDAVTAALAAFGAADITYTAAPAGAVYSLALEVGATAYDAAYLWLARELNVELVTLDGRLAALAAELRR